MPISRPAQILMTLLLAVLSLTAPHTSIADTASGVVATPPSDATVYLSDKIKWTIKVPATKIDLTTKKSLGAVCVPPFTTLRGIGTVSVDGNLLPAFVVTNAEPDPKNLCDGAPLVKESDILVPQDKDFLSAIPPDRYGLTYGTLIVPFKYHMSGSKDFNGNATIGGYLGFRQDRSGYTGLAIQYIAFIGASNIAVPTTSNGTATNQNKIGLSYGIGILGTVKQNFHLGLVLGADRVNPSSGYIDNGKPWIAISLGYDFSN